MRSHAYKMFESAARKWMILNPEMVDEARQLTLDAGPNRFIHIDTVFRMLRKNIFTKEQKPKRNDSSNRIKALHDVVAEMLGIDDCYFWSGSYDKVAVDDESEVGVDITMVISTYTDQGCDSSPANW